jgi:hypothetical protein
MSSRFHRDFTSHCASEQREQTVSRHSSAHGFRQKVSYKKQQRTEEAQETKYGGWGFNCSTAKFASRFHFAFRIPHSALRKQASKQTEHKTLRLPSAHVFRQIVKKKQEREREQKTLKRRRVVGEVSVAAPPTLQRIISQQSASKRTVQTLSCLPIAQRKQ